MKDQLEKEYSERAMAIFDRLIQHQKELLKSFKEVQEFLIDETKYWEEKMDDSSASLLRYTSIKSHLVSMQDRSLLEEKSLQRLLQVKESLELALTKKSAAGDMLGFMNLPVFKKDDEGGVN